MEERRVDLRIPNPERSKEGKRTTGILHRFNAADPLSVEYQELMKELFTCPSLKMYLSYSHSL